MRRLIAALLSMGALVVVLASGSKADVTIHVGSRTPPAEAHCHRIGTRSTDEGRVLNVYACPQ
jgi:hypothetical protein